MADHRAVLVRTASGFGIVTDSDLRRRVLSEGLSPDRPIAAVMTFPIHVVDRETLVDEVILEMLQFGVHHLPVVEGDAVIGMVSDLELFGDKRRSPLDLRSRIESASSSAELAEIGRGFPRAAAELWAAGVDAEHVGLWLGALTDRLTARLLDIGIDRLGPAPVGWAWLALGSLGRCEQALTADQDHALIYDDGGDLHDEYFAELAGEVVTGLASSGFPECASRVMATEPAWRMSIGDWLSRVDQWMAEPDRLYGFYSGIVFDYRRISGTLDIVPELDRMAKKAARDIHFVKRLSGLAVAHPSPLLPFGRLRTRDAGGGRRALDIKDTGLFPITEMARALTLGSGVEVPSTLQRLRRVGDDPEWSEASASLIQVFKTMQHVRLQHQVWQRDAGTPADDLIVPGQLDRLTSLQLRDAFRVLRAVMGELAYRLDLTK